MESKATESFLQEVERLSQVAAALENALARMEERHAALTGDVARISATIDATQREEELVRRLDAAERRVAELEAQADRPSAGRATIAAAVPALVAKKPAGEDEAFDPSRLDAALEGLSLEQRIAVKAQLMRTGAIR
jgi:TolA-binding protein